MCQGSYVESRKRGRRRKKREKKKQGRGDVGVEEMQRSSPEGQRAAKTHETGLWGQELEDEEAGNETDSAINRRTALDFSFQGPCPCKPE